MLTIFVGDDVSALKMKAAKMAKNSEVVYFGEGGEPFQNATYFLDARGLFIKRTTLIFDRPFETAEGKDYFLDHVQAFHKSETLVIAVTPLLDATSRKKIGSMATVVESDVVEKEKEVPPSVFALTTAFALGKRKDSWVLYRKLIRAGSAPEEIHGALSWQARAMVLSRRSKSASDSGLKPFVYHSAKRAAARFSDESVANLSRDLMHMVHQSRLGRGDLELLIEEYLLRKQGTI